MCGEFLCDLAERWDVLGWEHCSVDFLAVDEDLCASRADEVGDGEISCGGEGEEGSAAGGDGWGVACEAEEVDGLKSLGRDVGDSAVADEGVVDVEKYVHIDLLNSDWCMFGKMYHMLV